MTQVLLVATVAASASAMKLHKLPGKRRLRSSTSRLSARTRTVDVWAQGCRRVAAPGGPQLPDAEALS
eukprot:12780105-Prorocentrum_lima.AAC.1